jgi:Transcriptional regulators
MKDSNNIGLTEALQPDRESWADPKDALDLRLCLRLLACGTLIENTTRSMMRSDFGSTLPRFDLMAHLSTAPRGMRMSDLSRRMMVTNGNITGIVDQLERDGMVERQKVDSDRRSSLIRLTPEGRQNFRRMSSAYKVWVRELFSGMPAAKLQQLFELLGELKQASLAPATVQDRPH